ncbi:MAG: DUF58 domain-containing protein [Campylobacterales bacterium]|nr:DUF58 domain-containing protein [Campylobacterales bacterium]
MSQSHRGKKRAKELTIKARKEVFSEYVGSHITSRKGEGYDFAELREYAIGDDVRHIDWTITAKQQKPFVKLFHEENRLFINVISLLGGSVHFGSKRLKQDLIGEIAGILFFSAIKKQDVYSSYIYTDREHHKSKITSSLGSVEKEIEKILDFESLGERVDYDRLAYDIPKKMKKKSLLFIVGDFLENITSNKVPNLNSLAKKHEVVAIIVRDRLEESLGNFQTSSFVDPSSKKQFTGTLSKGLKKEYSERIKSYDRKLISYFNKNQIRYIKIYTDEEPFKKLLRFLNG